MYVDQNISAKRNARPVARLNGHSHSPTYARFLQADPLGYEDSTNLYAYVGGDPVNSTDPMGLQACRQTQGNSIDPVTGKSDGPILPGGSSDCNFCPRGWECHTPGPFGFVFGTVDPSRGDHSDAAIGGDAVLSPAGASTSDNNDDESDEYKRDLDRCRSLASPAARSRCYESANAREYARRNDQQLPPLITWRGAVTAATIGTILYWIVSLGSRVVFPPRNLVPIP